MEVSETGRAWQILAEYGNLVLLPLAALVIPATMIWAIVRLRHQTTQLQKSLQSAKTQRLAELNQLMVGLAHEVRNPLNSIRLNLYTADRVFRGDARLDQDEISAMLAESLREIERVDSLMKLLLGYARADEQELTAVEICQEILSVAQFLSPTFESTGVTLELDLARAEGSMTRAGRGHVRQVLQNLLNNAREAVSTTGGRVHVRADRDLDNIHVTITDNGNGVPPEHRERLFAPFFSTKEQATGLGLAIVRSLMERSGGHVACFCAEPGNCQFRVTWPALPYVSKK